MPSFLLNVPRPEIRTLFPYTTLFRSPPAKSIALAAFPQVEQKFLDDAAEREMAILQEIIVNIRKDRKSTRLNSSHRCISYAVFCLKKKKHKAQDIQQQDKHEAAIRTP